MTPFDCTGGPTPGPWPGVHRNQPNTVCPGTAPWRVRRTPGQRPEVGSSRASSVKPRGSAPGLTHPDLHALAIRATAQKQCRPADGTPDLHGLASGIPAPTPSTSAGGLTPGRRPGAHRNQPNTVCPGTARWRVRPPRAHGPGLPVTNPTPSIGAQHQEGPSTPGVTPRLGPAGPLPLNPGAWPRGWSTRTCIRCASPG